MENNKVHGFMDNLNILLVGAVLGCFVGACFASNYHTGKGKKQRKRLKRMNSTTNVLRRF